MIAEDFNLPILRSDTQLNEAPPEPEGAPTWTLYDPAANKYFKIGWLEFECLVRFKECRTVSQLVKKVRQETPLEPEEEDVRALAMFLIQNHLVLATGEGVVPHFETQRALLNRPLWERILHGYLFFTLPLFKPQRFLKKTYPYIKFLLTRQFMMIVTAALLYGIFLSVQRLDELTTTFMQYLSFEGVLLLLLTTVMVKIIHELGHAYVATKYGVPVTSMGVAFMVLAPILYTETTNAWKLQSRRDRLYIAGAGIMAELAVAAVALNLWHVLSPGIAQSICFMVSFVTLAASLAINASPMMKFDGYYLFSDLVGIDNLHDRSFAFAKWRLRRVLWGWDDPPPEAISKEKQSFFCAFGYATWIYRFLLYLGIALLVNHIFFQPLGFILMIVELFFFIALPIKKEIKVWLGRYKDIVFSVRGQFVILILSLIFLTVFVPFRSGIEIPAIMHTQNYQKIYPPIPARIDEVLVKQGQTVEKGQILFRLSSPNLDYNIANASNQLAALLDIRSSSQASLELAKKRMMIDKEIESARAQLESYQKIRDQLQIRASFAGQMKEIDLMLHPGRWVSSDVLLVLLVNDTERVLSGYIREQDISKLMPDSVGTFYPESSLFSQFQAKLKNIDETASYHVYWPELSSIYGGPVPSENVGGGLVRPSPRYTVYAVNFGILLPQKDSRFPDFAARGTIRINGVRETFANMLFKKAVSSFLWEGGSHP